MLLRHVCNVEKCCIHFNTEYSMYMIGKRYKIKALHFSVWMNNWFKTCTNIISEHVVKHNEQFLDYIYGNHKQVWFMTCALDTLMIIYSHMYTQLQILVLSVHEAYIISYVINKNWFNHTPQVTVYKCNLYMWLQVRYRLCKFADILIFCQWISWHAYSVETNERGCTHTYNESSEYDVKRRMVPPYSTMMLL